MGRAGGPGPGPGSPALGRRPGRAGPSRVSGRPPPAELRARRPGLPASVRPALRARRGLTAPIKPRLRRPRAEASSGGGAADRRPGLKAPRSPAPPQGRAGAHAAPGASDLALTGRNWPRPGQGRGQDTLPRPGAAFPALQCPTLLGCAGEYCDCTLPHSQKGSPGGWGGGMVRTR